MKERKKEKAKRVGLIITLSLLVTLIVTTSYALFTNSFNGTKTPTIDTNDLIFNYNETSNSVTLTDATSYTDAEGLTNGGTFTFDVSASSTKEQNVYYTIYLTEESTNTMDSSYVKLALLDNSNNTLVSTTSYNKLSNFTKKTNAKILYMNEINLTTQNNVKQNYVLKYWVDSKIEELTNTTEGNKQTVNLNGGEFKFKVNVMRKELTGAEMLIKKVGTDGLVAEYHPATEQLVATTDYRYTGANPNNYVSFNNELWRIIGVFDVDNGTGNLEQRIKIIRNESIGSIAWDSKGKNDWSKASGMTLLNSGGYWKGLTPEAKSLIADAKWYLGGMHLGGQYPPASTYSLERRTIVYSGNPTYWIGKVGLMYPSDYGYATSGGTTTTKTKCLSLDLFSSWISPSYSDCKNNDWLRDGKNHWVLTAVNNNPSYVLTVNSTGDIGREQNANNTFHFKPVVYLSPDIQITGGNGSSETPYQIS